jgi:hypothetical protein
LKKIYVYEITKPVEKFGWNVASIVLDKVYIYSESTGITRGGLWCLTPLSTIFGTGVFSGDHLDFLIHE